MKEPHDAHTKATYARYRKTLETLWQTVPDLTGAVLSRSDGFEVVSVTKGPLAISRLSALSSSLVALSQAALREMGLKGGGSLLIEGQEGKMLLLEVPLKGEPMVLAAVSNGDSVTGTLLWAARDCVRQLVNP